MNIIFMIISVFISTLAVIFPIKNFSKKAMTLKQFIVFFIILFPLLLLLTFYSIGIYKIICIILSITLASYFSIFKKNIKDALYFAFVNEIFVLIVEIILSLIMVSIFNFNTETYNQFPFSLLIFSVLNGIIVYIISKISFIDNIILKFHKVLVGKHYEIVYMIIIMFLMTILLFFNQKNLEKDMSFYVNIGTGIFIFLTLIYFIYKNIQSNNLENNYNEMMDYVCKYEKIINEQGKKNHEYNNQLMVIKGYINNKKKLEEYLNLIIEEHKCGQNYTIRELSYFPDGGIKGLIYHKLSKMEDEKIKYYLLIDQNTKNIFEDKFDIKTYQDITKLLGVFLDNAIEASKYSKDKEIELEIKNDDDSSIITISNTFNKSIDIKQIGKKGFTTKGKGHGYGLSIVKDIAKNNKNIDIFSNIENDKFIQTAIIYYKKK